MRAKADGQSTATLEDQRNAALGNLAQQIDVNYYVDSEGAMKVYTGSGQVLVGSSTTYPGTLSGIGVNGQDITTSLRSGTIAALMNLRQDGRYLFVGSRTDTAPVNVSALSAPASPSSADAAYYQGDSTKASVRISEQQTITYGVAADGSAFERALRAANILANMTTQPVDATAVSEAFDLATLAMDGLLAIQSGLAINSNRLETARNRHDGALSLLDNMISDIKSVDAAELAVKLSQYETQLQASYSVLGKIGNLTLTKYL